MAEDDDLIPADRLPPGFVPRIDDDAAGGDASGEVSTPVPSATVVLVRAGADGPEVLLLKRLRSSGFVPGAFVFPGGRVDAADSSADLIARTEGMTAEPEPAYWMAAAREVFEETGLLLGTRADGTSCASPVARNAAGASNAAELSDAAGASNAAELSDAAGTDGTLERWRTRLLAGDTTLIDVLQAEDIRLDFRCTAYCAHWITPVAEPRRYDTRFFLAEVPADCVARIDDREMSEFVWLTPIQALRRFEEGTLPMVFPTVRTLHELARFQSIDDALEHYRTTTIQPIQPRLVRRDGGYGIVVDDPKEDA